MVDVQRAAVIRSFAAGAASASATSSSTSSATSTTNLSSPHMYHQHKLHADAGMLLDDTTSDALFGGDLDTHPPYGFPPQSAYQPHPAVPPLRSAAAVTEDDGLFAAYAGAHPELDDPLRGNAWDLCYPAPPVPTPVTPTSNQPQQQLHPTAHPPSVPTARAGPPSASAVAPSSAGSSSASSTRGRTGAGLKRPLERPSPTTALASNSMLAMRHGPAASDPTPSASAAPKRSRAANGGRRVATPKPVPVPPSPGSSSSDAEGPAPTTPTSAAAAAAAASAGANGKKTKVSRERQLKINAASRRCRKKQKLELQFLRAHVVELQSALKDQLTTGTGPSALPPQQQQQLRRARLAAFLEDSVRRVDEMSAGGRPGSTPKPTAFSEAELQQLKRTASQGSLVAEAESSTDEAAASTTTTSSSTTLEAMTGLGLSEERKRTLLNIASFIRNNITLESQSFSPEVISCLPIEMDGWQLRLAITEKNYTIHNAKFFPCHVRDMYDFCWETNVATKVSIKQGKNDYCVVTPLAPDVAHVYSKTIGKWSLSVHGVPNVSYNSLVCRLYQPEHGRAIICQQSVLEDRDFEDESTIPWLFKRWVVFQPRVVDGVEGTYVEAYRTASYATGRLIYKEDNTYDSFCEHLIRRYAESNSLLERMMARDPRFQHVAAIDVASPGDAWLDHEETTSDRLVKDLLLF